MPGSHGLASSVAVPVVTTAETIVATFPAVSTVSDQDQVSLVAWAQMTFGGSTTAVTARIRRGTALAGALVGAANPVNFTAGQTAVVSLLTTDVPGLVAGQQYVFTVQQTAANANGSVLQNRVDVMFPTN